MADKQALLDTFSVVRRTWDDLISLEPDILAASGTFTVTDLVVLRERVEAHKKALDRFADTISARRG